MDDPPVCCYLYLAMIWRITGGIYHHQEEALGVEIRDLSPLVTADLLEMYFTKPHRSGSSSYEDVYIDQTERRAVITFYSSASAC